MPVRNKNGQVHPLAKQNVSWELRDSGALKVFKRAVQCTPAVTVQY